MKPKSVIRKGFYLIVNDEEEREAAFANFSRLDLRFADTHDCRTKILSYPWRISFIDGRLTHDDPTVTRDVPSGVEITLQTLRSMNLEDFDWTREEQEEREERKRGKSGRYTIRT